MASLFPNRDLRLRAHWLPSAVGATVVRHSLRCWRASRRSCCRQAISSSRSPDIAIAAVGLVGFCAWPFAFAADTDLPSLPRLDAGACAHRHRSCRRSDGGPGSAGIHGWRSGVRAVRDIPDLPVLWIPVTLVGMGTQAMRALLGSQFSRTKPQREPLARKDEPPSL